MIKALFGKLFGTHNERQLRRMKPWVAQINALEAGLASLDDGTLRAKTVEFKERLAKGGTLDQILPEAFAVVREAAKRTLKMRHFDVQLIGGMALHRGTIAEMTTGEGKTLVATLAAYLNALEGKGVHVITVNDYLARRDRDWMGPVYEFLGLTVGVIQHDMPPQARQASYQCDITYGTNNEFGFDYLRDNMVSHPSQRVQRSLHYGIIDEVDSILIDEARTPLIISGPSEESTDLYYTIDRLIPKLSKEDYTIEEKTRSVSLTEAGVKKAEEFLKVDNLYDPSHVELVHHVNQALRAHTLFKEDVDYVVKDGGVIIVDEFTGRLMPGRRFSDGLHQALEAKAHNQGKGTRVEAENQTLATITFQNYFRMYKKISGMTGTALTEAQEFNEIYGLSVLTIPTNRPLKRQNFPDSVYRTEREKFNAVLEAVAQMHAIGRPMLVGTVSIEKSEMLSDILRRSKIPHTVLNAKYHEKEAEIIKLAGQRGAVTIATNMAGRGTDIVLGPGVADLGGLHVIGTERHEARRIDNQLRGRTGRQGDPGSSHFYLSLEDDLMRIFGSDRISRVMARLGMEEGQVIQHGLVSRSIETAQTRVEGHNFEIRKQLLKFDDVLNVQRKIIYEERRKVLDGENLREYYLTRCDEILEDAASGVEKAERSASEADAFKPIKDYLESIFRIPVGEDLLHDAELLKTRYRDEILKLYEHKEAAVGPELMRHLERMILLEVVDNKWKDHLRNMDDLREGIGLRAYGQKDPIVEYRREGFEMFEEMIRRIKEDSLSFIFRVQEAKAASQAAARVPKPAPSRMQFLHPDAAPTTAPAGTAGPASPARMPAPSPQASKSSAEAKVGRNDPCPCGSGKKYKKCHGE